jgi:hypothetical protein
MLTHTHTHTHTHAYTHLICKPSTWEIWQFLERAFRSPRHSIVRPRQQAAEGTVTCRLVATGLRERAIVLIYDPEPPSRCREHTSPRECEIDRAVGPRVAVPGCQDEGGEGEQRLRSSTVARCSLDVTGSLQFRSSTNCSLRTFPQALVRPPRVACSRGGRDAGQ